MVWLWGNIREYLASRGEWHETWHLVNLNLNPEVSFWYMNNAIQTFYCNRCWIYTFKYSRKSELVVSLDVKKRGSTICCQFISVTLNSNNPFFNPIDCPLTKTMIIQWSIGELPDGPLKPTGCLVVVVLCCNQQVCRQSLYERFKSLTPAELR